MIKIIFFDFDGVIVESIDIKTRAFAQLFKHEGEDVVRGIVSYHLNNAGVSRYEKFRYIYKDILKRFLSNEEFDMLCNRFAINVIESVIKAPYVKGAKEFLENHASEYKCFVVSATPQKEIEEIILRRGIRHFFKTVYGAPTRKTEAVRDILVEEGINTAEALYVGDALSDYNAAKDNCVNFIARINGNDSIFAGLNCLKVKDLTNLKTIIDSNQYDFC